MKVKPAQFNQINLVPTDPFFLTPLGRTLRWALTGGRYLVIFTELIVIISFATRFRLDRQLTDLNASIHQKAVVIDSYGSLEKKFRSTQERLNYYKEVKQSKTSTNVFEKLTEIFPAELSLNKLTINSGNVVVVGTATSQEAFNTLIINLQLSPFFTNIVVGKIERDPQTKGFDFQFKADTPGVGTVVKSSKK